MNKLITLVALCSLMLFSGCTTMLKSDKIIAMKVRWFGIRVVTSATSSSGMPEIDLGWGSAVYQMIPTSTNSNIYAPNYIDTFKLGQAVNPFATEIIENTGTGNIALGTNATGSVIIPKIIVKPLTLER